MEQYGGAAVRFKRSVLRRATFTGGDTLDETKSGRSPTVAPARYAAPKWTALHEAVGDPLRIAGSRPLAEVVEENNLGYVEAQYHGRLTPDDVEEVVFFFGAPTLDLESALNAAGISFRVVQ
jgi:hypothetical protein